MPYVLEREQGGPSAADPEDEEADLVEDPVPPLAVVPGDNFCFCDVILWCLSWMLWRHYHGTIYGLHEIWRRFNDFISHKHLNQGCKSFKARKLSRNLF